MAKQPPKTKAPSPKNTKSKPVAAKSAAKKAPAKSATVTKPSAKATKPAKAAPKAAEKKTKAPSKPASKKVKTSSLKAVSIQSAPFEKITESVKRTNEPQKNDLRNAFKSSVHDKLVQVHPVTPYIVYGLVIIALTFFIFKVLL